MRFGINGSSQAMSGGARAVLADMAAAEQEDFSSYWVAQIGLLDALGVITARGDTGSDMRLGTAVVSTWERHPHALATQALTAQALVGDRLVVGIGVNHRPVVENGLHMDWDRPVRHVREYLDVLGDLLATGAADRRGEIWSYTGESARPSESVPSVMLAALGPQMLEVAGRRTDGTILWCVGPKTVAGHIAPRITEAAAAADRPAPAIVCGLPVWVTDEPERAREFLGRALSIYAELPSYRAVLDREGVHGLGELSLVGSEDEVLDGIGAFAEAGVTDFTAVPMGAGDEGRARTRALLIRARDEFAGPAD